MSGFEKKFLCMTLALLLVASAYQYRTSRFQRDISQEILRFHVLANSDSQEDQSVKLKVRDEIGRYISQKMQDSSNLQECMQTARENLPEIEKIAENVIAREGYGYSAAASLTAEDFPDRQYGSYLFPGGTYQTLQVVLGEGEGHNWWCVMYPNMCFSGSVYGVIDEEAEAELKHVLTDGEYEELMAESSISVKFKYWEKLKELLEKI